MLLVDAVDLLLTSDAVYNKAVLKMGDCRYQRAKQRNDRREQTDSNKHRNERDKSSDKCFGRGFGLAWVMGYELTREGKMLMLCDFGATAHKYVKTGGQK
jgi:hypothetical protein